MMPARAPVPHGPRRAVKKKLKNQLMSFSSRQEGGFVLVEGQAGMGKTALLKQLEQLSMAHNLRVLKGSCSAIDEATPLFVFSLVMGQLLDGATREMLNPSELGNTVQGARGGAGRPGHLP